MAAANLLQAVSSLLSVALLTSGGGSPASWSIGQEGYAQAEIQAELGVLGFNPGPVTGRVSEQMLKSADEYVATFGLQKNASFQSQLSATIHEMGTVPSGAHGALVLSVESDLSTLGLYHGTLNGQWSQSLTDALSTFEHQIGQANTQSLTASTLTTLAHLTAVAVTARHHWAYQAQPGDSLALLAFAAHLPYQGFALANNLHGTSLWAGQTINWKTAKAKAPATTPAKSAPPPSAAASPGGGGSSTSTGVLANLKPVADLVVLDPSPSDVKALAAAEAAANVTVDVSVSGQWALLHAHLVKALAQLGNELAISGYSGDNLNALPKWGVTQELTWGVHAMASASGTAPTFYIGVEAPNATVTSVADGLNLVAMAPNTVVGEGRSVSGTTAALQAALLAHPNRVVEITGSVNWTALFAGLKAKHFVFETLGQIWANQ
ncbi:MAG: polysaccharide deacetylase [Firmicutes bacterium]|nr:polysaccharide deacetylase [Bacillota bacterium]